MNNNIRIADEAIVAYGDVKPIMAASGVDTPKVGPTIVALSDSVELDKVSLMEMLSPNCHSECDWKIVFRNLFSRTLRFHGLFQKQRAVQKMMYLYTSSNG